MRFNGFLAGSIVLVIGLNHSPLLISIGIGIIFLYSFIESKIDSSSQTNNIMLLMIIFWLLHVLSGLYSTETGSWLDNIRIKMPFILLPIAFLNTKKITTAAFYRIISIFIYSVFVTGLITSINYFSDQSEMQNRILNSKEVPVLTLRTVTNYLFFHEKLQLNVSDITHIYYSLMHACSIFFGIFLSFNSYKSDISKFEKYILLIISIILVIMLHLFATRTGLFSFYITLFILAIISAPKINKLKHIIYIVCIILLFPLVVYNLFPSIQNRIHNSIIDANQFYEGNDLSNWSLARRLAAWQTTWHVIIEKPILGVGAGTVEKALQLQYDKESFILKPENRVMPHNQFLETWISLGLIGLANLILILYFFLFYIRNTLKNKISDVSINYLRLSFFIACISAMLVESILERQIGVNFFCYFALLLISYEPESADNHAL